MKAIQYIEDESFVVVNPDYPVVSKENALKAVEMAENEVKEKVIQAYSTTCRRYYDGKCRLHDYHAKCDGLECDFKREFADKLNHIK